MAERLTSSAAASSSPRELGQSSTPEISPENIAYGSPVVHERKDVNYGINEPLASVEATSPKGNIGDELLRSKGVDPENLPGFVRERYGKAIGRLLGALAKVDENEVSSFVRLLEAKADRVKIRSYFEKASNIAYALVKSLQFTCETVISVPFAIASVAISGVAKGLAADAEMGIASSVVMGVGSYITGVAVYDSVVAVGWTSANAVVGTAVIFGAMMTVRTVIESAKNMREPKLKDIKDIVALRRVKKGKGKK